MPDHFVLTLDQPEHWLTANERVHWSRRHYLTRYWRSVAELQTRRAHLAPLDRAHVLATFHKPTRRRYDPANLYPTVKAIVDGLVDAHLLPDDDGTHLDGPDMRAGTPGARRIVLTITPLEGTR